MKTFLSLTLLVALTLAEPPRYRQQSQQERQAYYVAQEEANASGPYPASGWRPEGPAFNLPEKQTVEAAYGPPKQQYGAPSVPQQQYGAPSVPQQQYGAPSVPRQQYEAPSRPQQQFGASSRPQQQFGAPVGPQRPFGAPSVPQQKYGAPSVPQQQYGAPDYTTTEQPNSTEDEESTTVRGLEESETEFENAANELEEGVDSQQPQQSGEYYIALPDGRLQRVSYVSRQDAEAMKYFAKIRAENVEPLRGPIYAYAPLQKIQVAPSGLEVAVGPPVAVAPQQNKAQVNEKLTIQPIAQVQYQYENPGNVEPLSSSYTTYTAKYQTSNEPRYILAL